MGSRLYGLIVTQNSPEYVWNRDGTNADLNISVSIVAETVIWKQMNRQQDLEMSRYDILKSNIDGRFSILNRKARCSGIRQRWFNEAQKLTYM